jgi:hypothetical protein
VSLAVAGAKRTTVDVLNGGDTAGLAGRVSAALADVGYRAGQVGDTSHRTTTAVLFGRGAAASAGKIAALLGVTAVRSTSIAAHHVEILLGDSATMPTSLAESVAGTQSAAPMVVIPTTGPQGGAVSARNGIPCVN